MALTVSAVSRRIQVLEQELGVKLFRRLPRLGRFQQRRDAVEIELETSGDLV